MNTSSLLYYKRFVNNAPEARKQIIAFCLHQNWFALPINAVEKVIFWQEIDRNSLASYQGKKLKIIDLSYQLFGKASIKNKGFWNDKQKCLIVISYSLEICLGIPLDSSPEVLRVNESAFTTLSKDDFEAKNISNINRVSSKIVLPDRPPLFWLEPQMLAPVSEYKASSKIR